MNVLITCLIVFIVSGCNYFHINDSDSRSADKYHIKGKVRDLPDNLVLLYRLYLDTTELIDSAYACSEGSFDFVMPSSQNAGMYRIVTGKDLKPGALTGSEQKFDLLFNYEDIVFETHYADPADSMEIYSCRENKLYYSYKSEKSDYEQKISAVDQALEKYPKGDFFYRRLEWQYNRLQRRRVNYIDNVISGNEATIFSSIARFRKSPAPDASQRNDIDYIRDNFFNEDDFTDTLLLYTDIIPKKILSYLELYIDSGLSKERQEEKLVEAAENVLSLAMTEEKVFYDVLEYMINGFLSLNMDEAANCLTDSYLHAEICIEEAAVGEAGEVLEEGMPAPDFDFTAYDGSEVDLYNIETEYVIVVFWASWCPFCTDVLNDLNEMYKEFSEKDPSFLEVVAIGIEEEKKEWETALKENSFKNWLNYTSLELWDCPVSLEYDIEGTPSLFLLDSKKKVVSKPYNIPPLRRYLSRRIN